jgi:hypothetical protein
MSHRGLVVKVCFCLCILLSSVANVAYAALGEDVSSIEHDRQNLRAQTVPGNSVLNKSGLFSVFVMQINGETIKEFVDGSGLVFAISWHGDVHPRLDSLLGRLFPYFAVQDALTPHGRRYPLMPIRTESITVWRGGHLYDFRGLAILNGKLPSGVTQDDLL